jgi:hypothetical protein
MVVSSCSTSGTVCLLHHIFWYCSILSVCI